MKGKIRVFSVLVMLLLPLLVLGRDDDEQVSRTVKRSFAVTRDSNLELINKYGQVVISPWDKDSVSITVEIIAFGKTRSDARKILERAEIDFDQTNNFLMVETVFDRNSSFFVELWKSVTDEATALLSKSKIEINYQVFVPSDIVITLDNKYGDVYLHELGNRLNLSVMHGNIRANVIRETANIELAFGNVRIKEMQDGRLTVKAADGDIIKMGNVTINSSSSDLVIREAGRVRIDSRSDKRLRFDKVGEISGKGLFSNISIGELAESLELDMDYGDLETRNVLFNFRTIDITARSTDIELGLSSESYIDVQIEGNESEIQLPLEFEGLERVEVDSRKNIVKRSGKVGRKNNYPAVLHIRSTGGDIIIDQKENSGQTVNK